MRSIEEIREEHLIPLVAGLLAWGVSTFLVGEFLGAMVGGIVGWILHKRRVEKERLQKLEEEERRRLEEKKRRWLQMLEEEERRRLKMLEEEARRRLQMLEEEERRRLKMLEEKKRRWLLMLEEEERRRLKMLEEEEKRRLQMLEEEERRKKRVEEVVSDILGVGAAALAAWGISKAGFDGRSSEEPCRGDEDEGKMMIAPGEGYLIRRDDFERNPAEYFRRHRDRRRGKKKFDNNDP